MNSEQPRTSRYLDWFCLALLLLVTSLVFLPLLNAHFLLWDDNKNIYQNPWYQPVSVGNTLKFWLETYNNTYRPLVHTVWAGIAWLSYSVQPLSIPGGGETQLSAAVFHRANLLLHLLNGALVWWLCRRVATGPAAAWAALGAALLFALHPVQVESVAWVTGFNELLCATFCILALHFYWRYLQEGQQAGAWQVAAFTCYLLALLVKPAAVALPLVLACFAVLLQGRAVRTALWNLAPWLACGLVWSAITALAHPPEYAGQAPPLWSRGLIAGDALAFYAGKLAWPLSLGIDYGRKPNIVLQSGWVYLAWLVPVGLVWLGYKLRGRNPWPLLAILSVLAWLLPVCGLRPFHFQLVYSTVADRYLYFALVPVAMAVAAVCSAPRTARFVPLLLLLAAFWGGLSFRQAGTWQDNFTLFRQALVANPTSWMAHANLGAALDTDGRAQEAEGHFRRALELKPDLWQMHVKLARYAAAAGRTAVARSHWQSALAIHPNLPEAREALATQK